MGARVVPVESGGRTLKDAINEALRDWSASFETTHYLLGTAAGPHPFPTMVREFQRVIGREARAQMLEQLGRLPDAVVACVGGGSNAIGLFADFLDDPRAADRRRGGRQGPRRRPSMARPCCAARAGILHGAETYVLQDADGQIADTWSVSAGLDYPAVGPEHAHLKDSGRAEYVGATDAEALDAFKALAENEGILCAFESAHALAHALKLAEEEPDSVDPRRPLRPRRQGRRASAGAARMSRYAAMFERLAKGEGAFGAFLMLGDPDLETSAALLDAVVEGGADMIEVGIPFSDPVADGPVIQAAAQRALDAGVRVGDCFELIAAFRARHPDVPLGILTYANHRRRARPASCAMPPKPAPTACSIADVPALEAEPFVRDMEQAGIEPVLIAAANTPERRCGGSPACRKPTPIASAGRGSPAPTRAGSSTRR